MEKHNSIELTNDIEYIKNVLFNYGNSNNSYKEIPDDFQTRCDFIIEQFKNMFNDYDGKYPI